MRKKGKLNLSPAYPDYYFVTGFAGQDVDSGIHFTERVRLDDLQARVTSILQIVNTVQVTKDDNI